MPYVCRKSGIYAIIHRASGTIYIGQSSHLAKRKAEHRRILRSGRHDNSYLQRAWLKYGEEAFDFAILEECATESLTEREQFWLDHYLRVGLVYNRGECADSAVRGTTHSAEARAKNREAHLGRSAWNKGRPWSPEHRAKLSVVHTGRSLSPEHRAKIAAAGVGRVFSAETCAKISAAQKGRVISAEQRAKHSAQMRGRKLSEEHRAKISAGMKRFKAHG